MNLSQENLNASNAAGFSLVELLLVITIIGVVASYAFLTFEKSTKGFKLAGATRTLSGYLEKARVDSVRRHGGASININSATSYTVNIDFGGVGVTTSHDYPAAGNKSQIQFAAREHEHQSCHDSDYSHI